MPDKIPSVSERINASYKRLSTAAINLNDTIDELGRSIRELDSALEKLSLGKLDVEVPVWIPSAGVDDGHTMYWSREIGYDRVNEKWGIAIRARSGNHHYPEQEKCEVWLFHNAPLRLQIEAFEKVPDLIDRLTTGAESGRYSPDGKLPHISGGSHATFRAAGLGDQEVRRSL